MMSTKFSTTDEKEFLEGYLNFTSKIRITLLEILNHQIKQAKTLSEKQAYYILGLEQLFLVYETYQGFYIALKNRKKRSFLDSLSEDNQNPQTIADSLMKKSEDQILNELNYKLENLTNDQKKLVEKRLLSVISMWKDVKFTDVLKTMFLPMFNAIKHKMMLYRKDKEIIFAFEDIKTENIKKILKKYDIKSQVNVHSLDEVLDIAKRLNFAIQDMIVLRLLELGAQFPISIYEGWEEVGI